MSSIVTPSRVGTRVRALGRQGSRLRQQRNGWPGNSRDPVRQRSVRPMSEHGDGLEQWRKMLESMLGPEAAEEAMRAISASGMDMSNLPSEIDPAQLQAAMQQMQQLLNAGDDGESQWRFARDVARQVAHTGGDPTEIGRAHVRTPVT